MNCRPFAVLLGLFFIAGCAELADLMRDDIQQLQRIESKLNDGDFDHALAEANKYVQDYPRSCRGWGLLGWIYLKTEQFDRANECFDKSLSLNPQWDNAHVGKGAMYRSIGDNANARKSYQKAISICPDNAEAFASLLVVELLEENDKKAVEYGEKAWAIRKDNSSIPANLAVAYHYIGDYSKRDYYYQQAKRLGYHNLQALKDIFTGKESLR